MALIGRVHLSEAEDGQCSSGIMLNQCELRMLMKRIGVTCACHYTNHHRKCGGLKCFNLDAESVSGGRLQKSKVLPFITFVLHAH